MGLSEKPYAMLARIGGAALLLLAVMVSTDVIFRATTGRPISGVFEMTRLLLLISFSLAIAPVQYFDNHLRVDILSANFRGLARTLSHLLDRLMTTVVFGMIAWVGASEGIRAYQGGFLQPGIVEIPTVVPLAFLVFGAVAVCFTVMAVAAFGQRRHRPDGDDPAG
jgi:TRAP-type C4-dicarboxylate transport system permease small subunit